jgi:hypothetical protein
MKNKYYFICSHCETRVAEYIFINDKGHWWFNETVGYPICKKCRLYEKLKIMGENVTTRVKILTLNRIRYVGLDEHSYHHITVKEDKKLYTIKGIIRKK